jgi:hypothetical protein
MIDATQIKPFSALYAYNYLTQKKAGNEVDRLGHTLYSSKIKLTPHQIQAALFAFKSPISKGVVLADEVGLGKTIEAGIVLAQLWFERKRKILIVTPASLIKQWQNELQEKFGLPSICSLFVFPREFLYRKWRFRGGYCLHENCGGMLFLYGSPCSVLSSYGTVPHRTRIHEGGYPLSGLALHRSGRFRGSTCDVQPDRNMGEVQISRRR